MAVTVRTWTDPLSWDQFTSQVPRPHFQQSWAWGELAPALGGQTVRLAALTGGEMVGAMQLFVNPLGGTGKTHLYVPRGPAVREPCIQILGPLFDAARRLGAHRNAIGIRMEPDAFHCDPRWKEMLGALGLRTCYPSTQPRSSWILDISAPEDTLLAGMKQKTRYNIRLAARKGVVVREGNLEFLGAFYRLFRETAQRDGFFIHDECVYREMFSLFWSEDRFALLLAHHEQDLIAAVTLVRFGPICWYLQGASSDRHRNLMAPHLLQWEAIRWARRQGCRLYDLRAVPDLLRDDQDMYGVYRFKEGFGGQHTTALHSYAQAYRPLPFGSWLIYNRVRFALDAWKRRRAGLPARQFA